MLNDTYRLLASVTVVRELYDADKSIYDVLQEFINEIIVRKRMYAFSAAQLTEQLNQEYSFQLSEPIVRTCLRRMNLVRARGEYVCSDLEKRSNNVTAQIDESEANNKILFSRLYTFLEKRLDFAISEQEKTHIRQSFCDFLLQDSLGDSNAYTQYFHEFVLAIEEDPVLMDTLRVVKEGTLIYEGIRYSSNINETGSWNSRLCLVLDTEILFAIGGYNSILYQAMYSELDKYLKEINRGSAINAPKIRLCYFAETKKEIDFYFESAERIVRGLDVLDPTKEAMKQIVNDCERASDVQNKKALFFEKLRSQNITLIDRDFYNRDNQDNSKYNLEDKELFEKYAEAWNEGRENIYRSLICLSHINILRKGVSNTGFENCSYIFLTATGRTLKLSSVPELLTEGNVPLATTFDFLINRFWFKLNKGFGINRTPRTMDMVMRARHILSSIINSKASEKYDEFKTQYEQEVITKEQFCALNNNLRSQLKIPSEIDKDTIGTIIDDLNRWNMDEVLENQRKRELELNKAKYTINQLNEKLNQSVRTQSDLESKLTDIQNEFEKSKCQHDEEKASLNADVEHEKAVNKRNMEDIEFLKKQLANEKKIRKDKEYKAALIKYYCLCIVIIVLVLLGIIGYIYASIHDLDWAKVISALIEVSAIITLIVSWIKKVKPKEVEYQIDEERCKTES